ncbi:MAG: hypothetical protein RTU63_12605, partial [Candidatus Thorarchaeota archaeon]
MKKSTTIVLATILTLAILIPQSLAATSQGLFYRMEDGDRFYFTMEIQEEGVTSYDELIYIEIEDASKTIPDLLTNLTNLDSFTDVAFNYENDTSMGLEVLVFILALPLAYPVGNWELITTLAETDLEGLLFPDAREITITQNEDIWGYSYKYNTTSDSEMTVWLEYSKFDGMLSTYYLEQLNTTTSESLGMYDISRFIYHGLEWGINDGDRFDYHLVITGEIGTIEPLDEYVYVQVAEEGLSIIPTTLSDFVDIPDIDSDTHWANDTLTDLDYFDVVIRKALPIGNWTLMDELIDAVYFPEGFSMDDSDPWFWGFSWDINMSDFIQEVHTDYLKVDGMVARHTVTITNATS